MKICVLSPPRLLLIVPYGIETRDPREFVSYVRLLIVPYGIETYSGSRQAEVIWLLIVPYGIETSKSM